MDYFLIHAEDHDENQKTMNKKKGILKKIILCIIGVVILFVLVMAVSLVIFEKNASVISKGEPIKNYGNHNCALLVVDIQEATTGETSMNSYYKEESDTLIAWINHITDVFKYSNSLIIYVRNEVANPLINLVNSSFARGGTGTKFDKRLKLGSDIDIVKSRNDAFINTELDSVLIRNRIDELYIVGLDAAYCINVTSEAARNRNYKVNLIAEAILSESEAMKDSMITDFKKRGMTVLNIKNMFIDR